MINLLIIKARGHSDESFIFKPDLVLQRVDQSPDRSVGADQVIQSRSANELLVDSTDGLKMVN